MTSPIAPAAPVATVATVDDALVEGSPDEGAPDEGAPDEEAPDFKPVSTPLLKQPEAFEITPATTPSSTATSELVAASSGVSSFSLAVAVVMSAVTGGALWRLFRRSSEQEASQTSTRISVTALEERIARLEGRLSAVEAAAATPAAAPASGDPVPAPVFDHEAMQVRMDEVEKALARIRKKAPPKRASASKE